MSKTYLSICLLILLGVCAVCTADTNPRVVLETNFGDIVIELYPNDAPITVANFLTYVNEGFYNGVVFHRAINQFMIQAGAYYVFDYTIYNKPPTYEPIENEGDNGLPNIRGTISTALTNTPDSATSQFFINQVYNEHLDHDYPDGNGFGHCVFGTVIEGMDIVDSIAGMDPDDICYVNSSLTHFPCTPPVYIHTAYELPCDLSYCSDLASAGRISFEDFAMFASHWLDDCNSENDFCDGADLDHSSELDLTDLDLFWKHWSRIAGHEGQFSDLIPDNTTNANDLMALMYLWLDSDCDQDNNYCYRADINRDGIVDFTDYALLSESWLASH